MYLRCAREATMPAMVQLTYSTKIHGWAVQWNVPLHDREMAISIQYHVIIISQLNDGNLIRCYIIICNQAMVYLRWLPTVVKKQ